MSSQWNCAVSTAQLVAIHSRSPLESLFFELMKWLLSWLHQHTLFIRIEEEFLSQIIRRHSLASSERRKSQMEIGVIQLNDTHSTSRKWDVSPLYVKGGAIFNRTTYWWLFCNSFSHETSIDVFFFFFFLFRLLQKHTHFLIDVVSITSYVTCIFGLLFWTAFIILFSLFRHNVCLWQMCALICLVFHQRASNWAEENKFKLLSRFVSIAWLWTWQITPFAIFTHTATYSPDIIWPVCDDSYSNSIICLFVEFWISSMWSQSRMQNTSTILK